MLWMLAESSDGGGAAGRELERVGLTGTLFSKLPSSPSSPVCTGWTRGLC